MARHSGTATAVRITLQRMNMKQEVRNPEEVLCMVLDQCDRILIEVCGYKWLVPESVDDAYQYVWCTDTTLATPFWCRLWQVEVRLGVELIQRQLLHSSANGVVSFICRYSIVELLYLFRLDLGKSCVSWE
ncbi:hypothetical protein HAX54_044157, partial [Datura stramonium]|nr:hypothetical protein [Datura stramonium]